MSKTENKEAVAPAASTRDADTQRHHAMESDAADHQRVATGSIGPAHQSLFAVIGQKLRIGAAGWLLNGEVVRLKMLRHVAGHYQSIWLFAVTALVLGSYFAAGVAEQPICSYFGEQKRWDGLTQLLVAVGSALVGSTAIAFSIVTFAMQINVERMPHQLFRRVSADPKILAASVSSFALALGVTSLSLAPGADWAAFVLVTASWLALGVFGLFVYAYRRALQLVSPSQQLALMVSDVERNLRRWGRLADRARLVASGLQADAAGVDQVRFTFLQANDSWAQKAAQGIEYATAYSRRFCEQSDYEIAGGALDSLVAINVLYVQAKGRTFFSSAWPLDNPYVTDRVVNLSLEQLRQHARLAVSRSDERQMELSLKAFHQLFQVYQGIPYQKHSSSKFHALLAASYLDGALREVVRGGFTDVAMEGVRLLGACAIQVGQTAPNDATSIAKAIGLVGSALVARAQPVGAVAAVEQLAKIELGLLGGAVYDVKFAIQDCRTEVLEIAKVVLESPDARFAGGHSSYLAPYFSGTSNTSLLANLEHLVNTIHDLEAGESRERLCKHLVDWADHHYDFAKQLLILSVEKRSSFTFDILNWIEVVTQIMVVAAEVCGPGREKDVLDRQASWLAYTLSWLPHDETTVRYLENFRFAQILFRIGIAAAGRDHWDLVNAARKMLLTWSIEGGRYRTGWATLETGMTAIAALVLLSKVGNASSIAQEIRDAVKGETGLSADARFRASEELRERAERFPYSPSDVDDALNQADPQEVSAILNVMADALDPTKEHGGSKSVMDGPAASTASDTPIAPLDPARSEVRAASGPPADPAQTTDSKDEGSSGPKPQPSESEREEP